VQVVGTAGWNVRIMDSLHDHFCCLLQSVEGEPHEKAVELLKAAQGKQLFIRFLGCD